MKVYLCLAAFAVAVAVGVAFGATVPYEKETPVCPAGALDALFAAAWERDNLVPNEASDEVLVRRLHLALAGRLPTIAEAGEYINSTAPDKRSRLVDRLLASEDFTDFWTMHFLDMLRVKSEFPINLWPNAVYVYTRRVREFVAKDEPYDRFARALVTSSGSNFRNPEVNFFRALALRTPEKLAGNFARLFLGRSELDSAELKNLTDFFSGVSYKSTREWKEEIVFNRPAEELRRFTLPNGRVVCIGRGEDARAVLADYLTSPDNRVLARALANQVWFFFFGRAVTENPDDVGTPEAVDGVLDHLAGVLMNNRYSLRTLCRVIAMSAPAGATSINRTGDGRAEAKFAVFPIRRLDAEVLDDAIGDITKKRSNYSSVIPEPFTYIPESNRTVTLADGSISSSFLLLFGRPARDSGLLAERDNRINGKQRLFLYNSGNLYWRIGNIGKAHDMNKLRFMTRLEAVYLLFLSRRPTWAEGWSADAYLYRMPPKDRWRFWNDLAWCLLNSKEFLYQH